jgi:hypothetical protein
VQIRDGETVGAVGEAKGKEKKREKVMPKNEAIACEGCATKIRRRK